jgi:hypothetical protein
VVIKKMLGHALCSANLAPKSIRPGLSLVGIRTRAAIIADLVAAAGDDPACDRLREELKQHDERREPFTPDGDIKPEWSESMSTVDCEVLGWMKFLAGPDPDDHTASLLRRGATCFRGVPTGQVLLNLRTGYRKPRFWRCPWPVCPKSCCPGSVFFHRSGYYRDVIEPAVSDLGDPHFWFVAPSIELPDEYSTRNLIQKAESFIGRQSGGMRLGSWMSRQDGRHRPIITGKKWLGEVSVATWGVVSSSTIDGMVLRCQTPPQLAFPMVLAVDRGSEFRQELMERRWLRLRRNLKIGIPKLEVVEMPDLLLAWQVYLNWWSQIWFEGQDSLDLARLLFAWHRQRLSVRSPLGALYGQVGARLKQARDQRNANPEEWVPVGDIEDLGEATEGGVWRQIQELNRKVREHEYRISALERAESSSRRTP